MHILWHRLLQHRHCSPSLNKQFINGKNAYFIILIIMIVIRTLQQGSQASYQNPLTRTADPQPAYMITYWLKEVQHRNRRSETLDQGQLAITWDSGPVYLYTKPLRLELWGDLIVCTTIIFSTANLAAESALRRALPSESFKSLLQQTGAASNKKTLPINSPSTKYGIIGSKETSKRLLWPEKQIMT